MWFKQQRIPRNIGLFPPLLYLAFLQRRNYWTLQIPNSVQNCSHQVGPWTSLRNLQLGGMCLYWTLVQVITSAVVHFARSQALWLLGCSPLHGTWFLYRLLLSLPNIKARSCLPISLLLFSFPLISCLLRQFRILSYVFLKPLVRLKHPLWLHFYVKWKNIDRLMMIFFKADRSTAPRSMLKYKPLTQNHFFPVAFFS